MGKSEKESIPNGKQSPEKKSEDEEAQTEDHGYWHEYPYCVFCIFGCEFCERFSYYGMRAILIMYLTRALRYSDEQATVIYHTFVMLCFFTPIIGAAVADGFLGKYKTIFIIGIFYAIGNAIMSISAVPFGGEFNRWGPMIGLLLIAFGTGGIKPNVSAFGGDQFTPEQDKQKDSFFSIFYMSINIGSLLSMIITPILRSDVYCFDTNCYSLAFGVPAILMIAALIFFVCGSKWYNKIPPSDNALGQLCKCIWIALKGKCFCNKIPDEEKKDHWLDYAEGSFSEKHVYIQKGFIQDVKDVVAVLWIFLPLPFYWALYEQQGSTWTLQAGQMNGQQGSIVIQPDQVQVLNPVIIIIILPLMEGIFYPCLTKIGVPHRPLQRLGCGMFLTACAFLMAAGLQVIINNSMPQPIESGMTRFKIVNTAPCDVVIATEGFNDEIIEYGQSTKYVDVNEGQTTYKLLNNSNAETCGIISTDTFTEDLQEGQSYLVSIVLKENKALAIAVFNQKETERNTLGKSTVWVMNALDSHISVNLKTTGSQEKEPHTFSNISSYNVSAHDDLLTAEYFVYLTEEGDTKYDYPGEELGVITSKNGAVYTIVIQKDENDQKVTEIQHTDVSPNDVNIFWQAPQYVVVTLGECLFSVTGLSFAYTQSPQSMKSVVTACWLLTDSIGNLIVIIVELLTHEMSQIGEFCLYAGLMFAIVLVFSVMSCFYEYVEPREEEDEITLDINTGYEGKDNPSYAYIDGENTKM